MVVGDEIWRKIELDSQVVKTVMEMLVEKIVLCRQKEHGKRKRHGIQERRRRS